MDWKKAYSLMRRIIYALPFVLVIVISAHPTADEYMLSFLLAVAIIAALTVFTRTNRKQIARVLARVKFVHLTVGTLVLIFALSYVLYGLFPYMVRMGVSEETRAAFSMDNFIGEDGVYTSERVMLLEAPRDAFLHRVDLISRAEEQIVMAMYSVHLGMSSDVIVGALLAAADRGVQVIILNDGMTGMIPPRYRRVLSAHDNIDIHLFYRFNLFRPQYLNKAFHDKYMAVDNRFLILGGRNIGDRYFNPYGFERRTTYDREVLVYNADTEYSGIIDVVVNYAARKLTYPQASLFNGNVRGSWREQADRFIEIYHAHNARYATEFDYYALTVPTRRITLLSDPVNTRRKEPIIGYTLMQMTLASDVIVAQSPYFVITRRNLNRFAEMVDGRDFTLSTNSLASTINLPAFSAYITNRRNIIGTGIDVYEYQSGSASLHGKTYIFDARLTAIGSFNMNERSLRSDTESMLVIDSCAFAEITLAAIGDQISRSLRVGGDNRYIPCEYVTPAHASVFKRAAYHLLGHLLRPLRFMF